MGHEANIIDYAIQDSAKDIADALIVSSSSTNLDSAISVVATGDAITMQEAEELQSITGYSEYSSNYVIQDISCSHYRGSINRC